MLRDMSEIVKNILDEYIVLSM